MCTVLVLQGSLLPCQKKIALRHKQLKLNIIESKQTDDEYDNNNNNNDDNDNNNNNNDRMVLVLQGSLPMI